MFGCRPFLFAYAFIGIFAEYQGCRLDRLRHVGAARISIRSQSSHISLPTSPIIPHKSSFIPITCNLWNVLNPWSNDPALHWTFGNNRIVGWSVGLFLVASKFHPISLNTMLVNGTWWSDDPTFPWTMMFSEGWVKCRIVWLGLFLPEFYNLSYFKSEIK